MKVGDVRKYGKPPCLVVLVHGGPGAAGEMKPVALELSKDIGVLEPLQTQKSVDGQVEELKKQIEKNSDNPVVLVGYSWGAWLSYILTSKHPKLIRKLALVGSGPFEAKYAKQIMPTRLSRLNSKDKQKINLLMQKIQDGDTSNKTLSEFGSILSKADLYNPSLDSKTPLNIQMDIYQKVWPEADEIRKSGKLLEYGKVIKCPVVVIHGVHDPHPFEGVKKPLSNTIKDIKFILLEKCGHTPWKEKEAKGEFYSLFEKELSS